LSKTNKKHSDVSDIKSHDDFDQDSTPIGIKVFFHLSILSSLLYLLLYHLESKSSSTKEAIQVPFKKEPNRDKGKSLITKKADFSVGNLDGKFWGDFNDKDEDNDVDDSCGNSEFHLLQY
jgi:hypothetical protein